ncbi:hypothetical protein KIH27_10910, partial [Mycobacterium sp. M1]|nr:hypothetical protein [Mycolicibacter acidiphilus]
DRGCTHPGCTVAGYHCQAHHNNDYAITGTTDADDLTWRCGGHHSLITNHGWRTRRRKNGDIETIPPPHADHGQPRTNHYHHPENLLRNSENDDGEDGDGDGP